MKKLLFGFLAVAVLLAGSVVPSYAGGMEPRRRMAWALARRLARARWASWVRGSLWVAGVLLPGPYVYAPPVVVAAPPVVVAAPAPPVYTQSPQYWYYCQNPAGYYPSVPQCPSEWLQVAPQPQ